MLEILTEIVLWSAIILLVASFFKRFDTRQATLRRLALGLFLIGLIGVWFNPESKAIFQDAYERTYDFATGAQD